MAGLAGWVQRKAGPLDRDAHAARIGASLSIHDGSMLSNLGLDRSHLLVASQGGAGAIVRSERWSLALHGAPRLPGASAGNDKSGGDVARAVLDAFECDGTSMLKQLVGPFALALISADVRRVIVATDKLGIRPLYYATTPHGVVFSSSLTSFRCSPFVSLTTRLQSIYDYLYFHMIPSPHTIFEEVMRLEPGTYVDIDPENTRVNRYWQLEFSNEHGPSVGGKQREELRRLIRDSVAGSVPKGESVGCFLSGGTDSSTVSGMLGSVTGSPSKTYSIGFDVKEFDEMSYARLAAKHFGTDHHEYYVTPRDVVDLLQRVPGIYGQPFGNSSIVPTYFCAKMASEDGVRHLLAGDGGDELFGGNSRYATQRLFAIYDRLPPFARESLVEPIAMRLPLGDKAWILGKVRRYVEQARVPMPDRLETYNFLHHFRVAEMFEPEFLESVNSDAPLVQRRDVYNRVRAGTMLNRMLALDFKYTLADNDLLKVNKMCEMAGVGVSYPLLSEELVAFSSKLPVDAKLRGTELRPFFKKALTGFLPDEVIRKKKHGFGLPVGDWLVTDRDLGALARDLLRDLGARGIVKVGFLKSLISDELAAHPRYYGGFVWVVMMLELWMSTTTRVEESST